MCKLLEKEVMFEFGADYIKALEELMKNLIEDPILTTPDWELLYELMCDTSNIVVGEVLGQGKKKIFYSIYYANKTLDSTQTNYMVIEKEMLVLVYAFEKFRSYLVETKL